MTNNTQNLTKADLEYIGSEVRIQQAATERHLLKVLKTGKAMNRRAQESLEIAGLIEFGSPREGRKYNEYRLTTKGRNLLAKVQSRPCQ